MCSLVAKSVWNAAHSVCSQLKSVCRAGESGAVYRSDKSHSGRVPNTISLALADGAKARGMVFMSMRCPLWFLGLLNV